VPEEDIYKPMKNNKLFKTLKHVQVSSLYGNYSYERLKIAKNLKSFHIDTYFSRENSGMKRLAFYLKKLPKDVRVINLENNRGLHHNHRDFYKIAKSIRFLRKLESFRRYYLIRSEKHVEKEMMIYSQVASRNKNIKELVYELSEDEQAGFQRTMRRGGLKYSGITGLKFSLESSGFPDYEQMRPFFAAETNNEEDLEETFSDFKYMNEDEKNAYKIVQHNLKRRDEEKEDDIVGQNQQELEILEDEQPPGVPESFLAKILMLEEIKPFYRFELFPDLRMLEITQKNHLYPLGSFVVDGFAALKKLESFKIDIYYRSIGSAYLFKGFLQLPLLKKFFLAINFIREKDWALIQQFLDSQGKLETLSIIVRDAPATKSQYLQHNSHLQNLIKCLQNKSSLTSLELKSNYWSLETFSKALDNLKMKNQLQVFKFAGADDTITSEAKSCKRIEGLCNLIKNQKKSLKTLQIILPFISEEEIVIYFADAFSKLTQLRELYLSLNYPSKIRDYFENQLENGIPITSRKKWNPNLKKYLKRLQNLENFTFNFDIYHSEKDSKQWFFDVLTAFPSLSKLKKVMINTELPGTISKLEEKVDILLQELKNIKNINMNFRESLYLDETTNANFMFKFMGFNEVQSQRSDLMF